MGEFKSRFRGYNVLDRWSSPDWDDQTREVIRRHLENYSGIRFFTQQEERILWALCDRILPQPDRPAEQKVPIVPLIDAKLFNDERDGYRYEDLPPQREAWRLGLAGVNETAQMLFAGSMLVALDPLSQDVVLTHVARGDVSGAAWKLMPSARFFKNVLCMTIVKAYYSHPLAWNEIGYSGPSSARRIRIVRRASIAASVITAVPPMRRAQSSLPLSHALSAPERKYVLIQWLQRSSTIVGV